MAGGMRKMAVYLGLVEDDQYDEYEQFDDEARGYRDERFEDTQRTRALQPVRDESERAAAARPEPSKAPRPTSGDYRITTLHPRTYNDARGIGEAFREGTPVIMNLSDMDDADAKRIVDFAAGLIFGLRGSIERVTQKVFLLSPADVVVTAEEKQRLAAGGFFNQS